MRAKSRHTFKKLNSCMVPTSCVSVAVSNMGAEWLVGGNVICDVLMACCRCVRFRCLRFGIKVHGFRFRLV